MPKFAANLTTMFTELPFLERFSAAADAGFKAVEYLFPYEWEPEVLSACLHKHNLKQVLFNLHPGAWEQGERGYAAQPGREKDLTQAIKLGIRYAEALGCNKVHLMSGFGAGTQQEKLQTYTDNIRRAAEHLADYNITLCLEPINHYSMPGYFLHRQDQAAEIIKSVNLPNLALQFDIFHCQMEEGNVSKKILKYKDIIGHYQLAGVPERHEPDQGELDYGYIFKIIDGYGYDGYIGCEYNPATDTMAGLEWFEPFKGSY